MIDFPGEFDFFMDEDTRSRRIGLLCVEKTLTPAMTQSLFRARECHLQKSGVKALCNQTREIKWSSLNAIRSFIAVDFLKIYFHYSNKGPLPITFFNAPFINSHENSIDNFFDHLAACEIPNLNPINNSGSILFVDTFTSPKKYRFEANIRAKHNLSRCFRIDSRSHDLMQLTDLLLGLTVMDFYKKDISNPSKIRLFESFKSLSRFQKGRLNFCYYL